MTFVCTFRPPSHGPAEELPPLEDDENLDDETILIMRACELLGSTDAAFSLGGFGTEDWHAEVGYDMSTLLEQLSDMVRSLAAGEPGVLELYGQGMERTLTFERRGADVDILCISGTSWIPQPDLEVVGLGDLDNMFRQLTRRVAESVHTLDPELAAHEPLNRWRQGQLI